MKRKYYALVDSFGKPVLVIEARNLDEARKRVKKIDRNTAMDLIKKLRYHI